MYVDSGKTPRNFHVTWDQVTLASQGAAAGAPGPTCLESTPEQLAHSHRCRLPKYPYIKAYPIVIQLKLFYFKIKDLLPLPIQPEKGFNTPVQFVASL